MSQYLQLLSCISATLNHKSRPDGSVRRRRENTFIPGEAVEGFLSFFPDPFPGPAHPLLFKEAIFPSPLLPKVSRRMWPGAIQYHFNLYLQFSKSLEMSPQAVGKQISGSWCLQGKLLTYLHPNCLIRLTTDVPPPHSLLYLSLQVLWDSWKRGVGGGSQVSHHHGGDNTKRVGDDKFCFQASISA